MKLITRVISEALPIKNRLKGLAIKAMLFCIATLLFAQAKAGGGGVETKISGIPMKTTADISGAAPSLGLINGRISIADYTTQLQENTQQSKTIKNVVTFSIDEANAKFISADFTANATVKIEYGHNMSTLQVITKTFTVDYKKAAGAKFNAKKYFSFEGAEYVKITLMGITATPANLMVGNLDIRDVLVIENDMYITRFFELPTVVPAAASFGITTQTLPPNTQPDHLAIYWNWPLHTGHNATQLEWAWIENEMAGAYMVGGAINNDLIFANSSRVDLSYNQVSYDIPLLYDGVGKLYYRIRAVNIKESGNRSDGPWNTAAPYDFTGHNNNLNWQSTTSFAEEGKRKSVIQYFDGSLRGRQTVTKDNSVANNNVVIAESFYDGQGRPTIQILPTPGIGSIIQYQANLNFFNGQAANTDPADIFDMQPIATPNSLTPTLATSTGTSKYYSPANTNGPANLPDAEGYPYTVTRFTPDASGRIMSQSGVGASHKLGSGHETKYWYGGAAQEELDGLFGTEVGNNTHYSKNMVKDANNQMSISYVDMHGRTIATALAGDKPASLQALNINNNNDYPNQAGTTIVRNLLDVNTNVVKGNSIESINSILVPATTNYLFTFRLSPQTLQVPACPGAAPAILCYDCLYDLEIAITDESGEGTAPFPVLQKFKNISLSQDDNCATPVPPFTIVTPTPGVTVVNNTITFTQQLLPGSYSIRKTLTISEASLQIYKDLYMTKALCKTEQQIIDSIYTVMLSTSNCGNAVPITCQNCLTELGTFANYRQKYLESIGLTPQSPPAALAASAATAGFDPTVENDITTAYNQAKHNCDLLCNSVSQNIPTIREMMLADMVPYTGQYASENAIEFSNPPNSATHPMYDKYNVFSTLNSTPANPKPFYKYPWSATSVLDYYRESSGNIDLTIHPTPTPPDNNYTYLNTLPSNGAAAGINGFVQLYKPSWAEALLPHHPEYQRLLFAENNMGTGTNNSYNWINTFSQKDTWDPIYATPNLTDPFFTIATSYASSMAANILNYRNMSPAGTTPIGMWKLAYGEVGCKTIDNPILRKACYEAAPNMPPPYAGNSNHPAAFSAAENNQAWKVFRGLYAAVRNEYVDDYIATQRPLGGSAAASAAEETALIEQHYHLWFPRSNQQSAQQNGWSSWWPANINTPPGGGVLNTSPTAIYEDRCNSYINSWKTKLLQCSALAALPVITKDAILTQITDRMKVVCVKGSNPANAYGSSNVAPGVVAADQNFEDVIRSVFMAYGIMDGTGKYNNEFCNPYVIDWPKPYGKGPKMIAEMTGQIDSCNCKAYELIKTAAAAANFNPTNFTSLNLYLQGYYGQTITQGMFDGLQHCNELQQITCTTSDTTLIYNCNEPEPTCPGVFNKAAGTSTENVTGLNCTGLTNTVQAFLLLNSGLSGKKCKDAFVIFFQNQYGYHPNWDTWLEIYTLYNHHCKKTTSNMWRGDV
jgi:hypothetical protein